jgi:tetratricopeptide (TPR) repeat protein
MNTRRKLGLALAAVGLAAGAAVPFAQSGDVYVSELATVDTSICRPQRSAGGFSLVRAPAASPQNSDASAAASPQHLHLVVVSAQLCGDGDTAIASAGKLAALISSEAAREALVLQPIKAAQYFAHAQFSDTGTVMRLPRPARDLPYVETAWRYARGISLARNGDLEGAARELAELDRINAENDYKAFEPLNIPAKDVGRIAAHVLRARIAQHNSDLDGAVRELEAAIAIQDRLLYVEPAYWYYPVRQTLGAVLLLKGDSKAARAAFGASLARTPNNAWALYGLAQAYSQAGLKREAKAVEARFTRAWTGTTRKKIVLEAL